MIEKNRVVRSSPQRLSTTALTASAVAPRSAASRARSADSTETLADGWRTVPAASAITRISDAEAPATNREPDAALSTFKYATAQAFQPFRMFLCPLGGRRQPELFGIPAREQQRAPGSPPFALRRAEHPDQFQHRGRSVDGSTPPKTQASRWLPTMTTESGSSLPRRSPVTVQTGRTASSLRTLTRTGAAPGPTCERNVAYPQCTGAEGPPRVDGSVRR